MGATSWRFKSSYPHQVPKSAVKSGFSALFFSQKRAVCKGKKSSENAHVYQMSTILPEIEFGMMLGRKYMLLWRNRQTRTIQVHVFFRMNRQANGCMETRNPHAPFLFPKSIARQATISERMRITFFIMLLDLLTKGLKWGIINLRNDVRRRST